jgi:hypothetical protein
MGQSVENEVITVIPMTYIIYYLQVSQNSQISNSERGREGPSGARKILRKKNHSS